VYLGDDVTDEDAFAALAPPAVTVKVGPGETVARYRLPDIDAVVAYLRQYVGA
jgi:trehalose 6-phosphate phosphatase